MVAARSSADPPSPELDLLLRRPDHKRDVAKLSFLLPDVERRSFQHVSVHQRDGPDKVSSEGEVCEVSACPGGVLLPGDGLGQNTGVTTSCTAKTPLFSLTGANITLAAPSPGHVTPGVLRLFKLNTAYRSRTLLLALCLRYILKSHDVIGQSLSGAG